MQKQLKNLYDNYIAGFPENNSGNTRYVENIFEDKILTEYYDNDQNIKIEITDDFTTNQFVIKKTERGLGTVYIGVHKKKGDNTPEQTIKKLYETIAITK